MITRKEAQVIVEKYLHEISNRSPGEITIIESDIVEKDYGWIFNHESTEFLRTQNRAYKLIGKWPVLVSREGKIVKLRSGPTMAVAIEEFEKKNPSV